MKSNREWFTLLTKEEQEKFKRNCDDRDCNGLGFNKYMELESERFFDFVCGNDLKEPFRFSLTDDFGYWRTISLSNRELNDSIMKQTAEEYFNKKESTFLDENPESIEDVNRKFLTQLCYDGQMDDDEIDEFVSVIIEWKNKQAEEYFREARINQ